MVALINISECIKRLENYRQIVMKELRSSPPGKLYVIMNRKRLLFYQIYQDQTHKRVAKGVTKNKRILAKLARKLYLQNELKAVDINIKALKDCQEKMVSLEMNHILHLIPEKYFVLPLDYFISPNWVSTEKRIYPTYDENVRPMMCPTRVDMSQEEFRAMRYRQNSSYLENKVIPTRLGFKVRSKSESIIVDCYERLEIGEHYDQLIQLADGSWASPDFIFMRRDGSLVLHEHFGKITDPHYAAHVTEKLIKYEASGYHLWDNLIFTFDSDDGAIDAEFIEATILHYYNLK